MIELKNKYTGDIIDTYLGTGSLTNIKFDKNKDYNYVDFENLELLNCDFSDIDLSGVEFKHCYIKECDFSRTNLINAEFNFCEISFCKFNYSKLSESYFCHCEIRNTDYSWTKMEDNIIEMSYLFDVSFEGIDSSGFEISSSMLHEVTFLERTGDIEIEFDRCSLQNIAFDTSGYKGCSFSDCIFDYIFIDGNIVGNNIGSKTVQNLTPASNNSCNICRHYSLLDLRCIKNQMNCDPSNCCMDFKK